MTESATHSSVSVIDAWLTHSSSSTALLLPPEEHRSFSICPAVFPVPEFVNVEHSNSSRSSTLPLASIVINDDSIAEMSLTGANGAVDECDFSSPFPGMLNTTAGPLFRLFTAQDSDEYHPLSLYSEKQDAEEQARFVSRYMGRLRRVNKQQQQQQPSSPRQPQRDAGFGAAWDKAGAEEAVSGKAATAVVATNTNAAALGGYGLPRFCSKSSMMDNTKSLRAFSPFSLQQPRAPSASRRHLVQIGAPADTPQAEVVSPLRCAKQGHMKSVTSFTAKNVEATALPRTVLFNSPSNLPAPQQQQRASPVQPRPSRRFTVVDVSARPSIVGTEAVCTVSSQAQPRLANAHRSSLSGAFPSPQHYGLAMSSSFTFGMGDASSSSAW